MPLSHRSLISRPLKTAVDVAADDLPADAAAHRDLAAAHAALGQLLAVKDDMIQHLLAERQALQVRVLGGVLCKGGCVGPPRLLAERVRAAAPAHERLAPSSVCACVPPPAVTRQDELGQVVERYGSELAALEAQVGRRGAGGRSCRCSSRETAGTAYWRRWTQWP